MVMRTRQKWVAILVMLVALLVVGADFGYTDRGGHGHSGHRGHGFRGHHHHRHGFHHGHRGPRVHIGIGTFWGPYWPDYAYPQVVVAPPPVVVQPSPPHYWYYCDSAKAYYPYVAQCPSGWRAVSPAPE
jgi:hypothetical protein